MTKEKIKEKTFEESLKDPIYVNYNLLLKLEEIKKILLSIHEMIRIVIQKPEEKKEKREGVIR